MRQMRYTWDVDKAVWNLRVHKIAFEDAVKIFDGPTLERLDDRFDYREERWYAVGLAEGPSGHCDLYRRGRTNTPHHLSLEG